MASSASRGLMRSWETILGFACNQGFIYALFYLEPAQSVVLSGNEFVRVELIGTLLFMALTFYAVASLSSKVRDVALSPRFVLAYACLLVLGSGVPTFVGQQDLVSIAYESICVGIPSALMLCAWGRVLGWFDIRQSVPAVFLGLGLGAAICFVFSIIPVDGLYALLYFAPLGSAFLLKRIAVARENGMQLLSNVGPAGVDELTHSLTAKILFGTSLYGIATGLVEAGLAGNGLGSPANSITMFLLVMFCVAAMQLFEGRSVFSMAKVTDKSLEADAVTPPDEGPLDSSYRLAILLMVCGCLFAPIMASVLGYSGASVVIVGFLGLTAVLMSLFLVMAHVSTHDAARSFALGFMALYAGQIMGLLVGNAVVQLCPENLVSSTTIAISGLVVLISYLYLFTNRDMKALSIVVERADAFEAAVLKIVEDAKLSKREAEILPLALRGRTGERIAAELYISKNTVDTHIKRIYAKCGVHSRQELIDLGERTQQSIR